MNLFRALFQLSLLSFLLLVASTLRADSLDDLAQDFWKWRAAEQPFSSDDIPRLERPADWTPDWSAAAIGRDRQQLHGFEVRWKALDPSSWPVARQVDFRLMGSALARVRWELDVLRSWQRNPMFYVDQTAAAYHDFLLPPPPFSAARSRTIARVLAAIPATLDDAKQNLTEPVGPFAQLAISALADIRTNLLRSVHELEPSLDASVSRSELERSAENAAAALENFRTWLQQRLPGMSANTAVSRDAYIFFLKNVALLPFSPEQLLAMGHQEWARAVASQSYEEHRNLGVPELHPVQTTADEIALERQDENKIRQYLQTKHILTVPASTQHYEFREMPAYLVPVADFGEADDFTSSDRMHENGVRYVTAPASQVGYFAATMPRDPRCMIVHEGVPGHYFQLALSWAQPDSIRRHYYDSSANEGIGFYAEEMMLHAGLFDDSPRTREIIWNFMRLRALRVEVDVRLALGEFGMEEAAQYLRRTVPMDNATAHDEASFFASQPGQAISYEIGKLQIYDFLAAAQREKADFNLQAFHDFLWRNGNVPMALQQWEYLGQRQALDKIDRLP